MRYLTVQEVTYDGPGGCEERFDPLMEALLAIENHDPAVVDPDIAADAGTGRVDVQMIIDATDPAAAMVKAQATLRAAIHAIGDATSGWETTAAVMHVAPAEKSDRLFADA